jgi:hypothetical protein
MINKTIFFIFFLLVFLFFLRPFEGTGDFYHHVNTGRYIVETHQLPNLDTFSHTANNLPWVAHSWLSGLIFYLILQNFGEFAISIFGALLAVFTFVIFYLLLRSYKASKIASIITTALTAVMVSTRWPQRPEIFTYPLVICILLVDVKRRQYPKISLLFPLLLLLWANLYGSGVLFGLGLIALLIGKQFLIDKFRITKDNRFFYILSLISFPLSLINGYGLKTILYFYYFIPKVSIYEGEWAGIIRILDVMPVSQLLSQQYYILIYILYLILFLILVLCSLKILKQNWFPALLALSVFIPFFAFRQLPLAAILSGILLSISLTYQIEKRILFILGIFSILAFTIFAISIWINPPFRFTSSPNIALKEMIAFIENNNLLGNAFNQGHFGGYLTYKLYPKVLVFFDTRDELYVDTPALKDLYDVYNKNGSVIPLLKKYQVDLVIADYLTDGFSYEDLFYSLDWSIVYLNDRYFIAVPAKIAKQKNLQIIDGPDPFSPTAAKPGEEQKASEFYRNLLAKNPDSLNNKLFLASTLLSLDQFDETVDIIKNLKIDLYSVTGGIMEHDRDNLLAQAYLGKNDCQNTKIYLDKADGFTRPVFIFKPQNKIVSKSNKIWAYYYLICQKDLNQAEQFSQNYLKETGISPLEKMKFSRQFEELKNKSN